LTPQHVVEVAGLVPDAVVSDLLSACKSNSFDALDAAASECVLSGYPVNQVFAQLLPFIVRDPTIRDVAKSRIAIRIADSDKKLVDGADEQLQLTDVMSFIATTILERD